MYSVYLLVVGVLWGLCVVGSPYMWFRFRNNDWALALLVGALYLTIGLMDFISHDVVVCVPGRC